MVFISENITRMLIRDGYVYRNTPESLYRLDAPTLENLLEKEPERAGAMRQAMNDFYETTKFLLYNNSKARLDASKPQIIRLPPLMEKSSPPAARENACAPEAFRSKMTGAFRGNIKSEKPAWRG